MAVAAGAVIRGDVSAPTGPGFQAVLIGGKKNLFGLKSVRHCDFKGGIFRDQAFSPRSLEISVLRTLTLISSESSKPLARASLCPRRP